MMSKSIIIIGLAALMILLSGFRFQSDERPEYLSSINISDDRASWSVDYNHSEVGFSARHMGMFKVRGDFRTFSATIEFDESDLNTLEVSATIEVESLETGVERRDNHLRSSDFFDVATYPKITFTSKEIRNVNGNEFELVGDLTIKDVTKEFVLEGTFLGAIETPRGKRAGFELSAILDRFDYHLNFDRLTEAGGLIAGREITITLSLELTKQE